MGSRRQSGVGVRILPVLLLGSVLLACSAASDDTYWRFVVDGDAYQLGHVEFVAMQLPDPDRYFLALGQDPAQVNIVTAVPGGAVQWRMRLDRVEDLEGRDLDLGDVVDDELGVNMQFTLPDDVGVHLDAGSELVLRISRVEAGYLEGSFAGTDLTRVSMTREGVREVDVSGEFRAKLSVQ